jgi:putative ABC transport system permease protein
MHWLWKIAYSCKALLLKGRLDAQMSEEMRLHLEMETEAKIAAGMPAEAARYAAEKEFGNVASIQERTRQERGWLWLEQLLKDCRFTLQSLARARGFSLTVITVLTIGITVAAVVWNYTYSSLFRPPPFPDPDRLVLVRSKDRTGEIQQGCFGIQFRAYQERNGVFSEFAAMEWGMGNVVIDGQPHVTIMQNISSDFFHTLGIKAVLGRVFSRDDFENAGIDTIVISERYWREQFNSSADMIGRQLTINRHPCVIVGVVSTNNIFADACVYRPLLLNVDPKRPFQNWLTVIGRLRNGVTMAQATDELSATANDGLTGWA